MRVSRLPVAALLLAFATSCAPPRPEVAFEDGTMDANGLSFVVHTTPGARITLEQVSPALPAFRQELAACDPSGLAALLASDRAPVATYRIGVKPAPTAFRRA